MFQSRYQFLGSSLLLLNSILGASATTGSLKVLTYNVAGLPSALSSSDPVENTPYISARLSPYAIINVQEDFNSHAALYASDSHAYRTPTSGGVPFGDGLNTLSDFPYIDFTRTAWDDCNLNSGDCLTPKGFSAMRVEIAAGIWIDVYNLHTDAGGESGDLSARAGNVAQIVDYINSFSAGMPVVLMGDTNMRYTTTGDNIRALVSGGGFTDAWVSGTRGGTPPALGTDALTCAFPFADTVTDQATMLSCEVVDKILFRSSPVLTLSLGSITNEHRSFLHPTDGGPLSDHYPLSATFTYSTTGLRLSEVVGGPHGDYFNDATGLTSTPTITTLKLAGGERVDSVSSTWSTGTVLAHGGSGGTASSITLASGETLVEVEACQGEKDGNTRVFYLRVKTSAGRELAVGKTTSTCTVMSPPETGMRVVGFWGRDGDEIDRLGVVWGK
ncbi:uncharacterized protein H6S33_010459 [Morchella sextelata]|uniref:uncharacterized protein n=1 Tax=Morchella sextelata TaxID=1174677 RepID=UPI001D048F52|nr:uncharacterized protein H6S33_010459 [Morchella sextelata]KAH0612407.1 hypothetical protein H6S33_010459 [Morchella sextelata]